MPKQRKHRCDALQGQFTFVRVWGLCRTAHCRVFSICGYALRHLFAASPPTLLRSSMQHFLKTARPLVSLLALALATVPVLADSTSSASSASSTSIGSSSASVEKSSNSSSTKDKVAQGPYTVVEMVALAQRPDMLRLRLQAVATNTGTSPPGEFVLLLPREAAQRGQLVVGQVVSAEHRPYGVAFATITTAGNAATPFFLVLDDAWFGELQSRPLGV